MGTVNDACGAAEADDRTDSAVMGLLLDDESQRPWSEDELAREIGDDLATADSLSRLHRAGLIHRIDPFVFATRPAWHAARVGHD
jgi:predicted transcriptional regulator